MSDFGGFGEKTTKFIQGLSRNNDKARFDDHRKEH